MEAIREPSLRVPVAERLAALEPRFEKDLYSVLFRPATEADDGAVILDAGRLVFVNDAFARMTGYPASGLTAAGFDIHTLFESGERLANLSTDEPSSAWLLHRDGRRVAVGITVKPIHAPGHGYRLAFIRDLTGRRGAREDVDFTRHEAARSEKIAALGSLVSGVAHEVRTPLAYLSNHVYLIESKLKRAIAEGAPAVRSLAEEILPSIESAHEGVERIQHLVRDLHHYTRQRTGEPTLAHLDQVVAEALEVYRATHPASRARIVSHLEPMPRSKLDKSKIQQVVLNLVENGDEAMPGGGDLHVALDALPDGARLVVHDEGPGIPPDVQGKMFEPLYTTRPGGMGLGLSIVRRIVEGQAGRVTCESRPGAGARFSVFLPSSPLERAQRV